jgi:hypothetical protein
MWAGMLLIRRRRLQRLATLWGTIRCIAKFACSVNTEGTKTCFAGQGRLCFANSMRTESGAIPWPRRPPIQVIPHPRASRISPGEPRSGMLIYIRMREPGRFQTTLDWIRRLDHTGGATLPVAHEKRPCCATRTARMKWSTFAVASMYWSIFDFASCARTRLTTERATAMEI